MIEPNAGGDGRDVLSTMLLAPCMSSNLFSNHNYFNLSKLIASHSIPSDAFATIGECHSVLLTHVLSGSCAAPAMSSDKGCAHVGRMIVLS